MADARSCLFALRLAAVFAVLCGVLPAGAANFTFTALRLNGVTEDYVFTAGDRVVPVAQLDSNVWYKVTVRDPSGGVLNSSFVCTPSSAFATTDNSYVIQPTDPLSTSGPYTFTLEQFTNGTCGGVATASASKQFYVAGATAYTGALLSTTTNRYASGQTAFVTIEGLPPNTTGWSVTWVLPSGANSCANTSGSDRPSADADSLLPDSSFLAYPPISGATDPWNNSSKYDGGSGSCQIFSVTNQGQWRLRLQRSVTSFTVLPVFVVSNDCTAPVIYLDPVSASVCVGSLANFSVFATGTNLTYQWRRNGTNLANGGRISGVTSAALNISGAATNDAANYSVAIVGDCGAITSAVASLTVNLYSPCFITGALSVCQNSGGMNYSGPAGMAGYAWSISGNGAITSGAAESNVVVESGSPGTYTLGLSFTNSSGCTSNCSRVVSVAGPSAVVSGGGTICLGSNVIIRAALTGSPPWMIVWSDGFVQSNILSSPVTRTVAPATTTVFTVTDVRDAVCVGSASGSATATVNTAPTITINVVDRGVCVGGNATFVSAASGAGPITRQWQASTNGGLTFTNISRATNATLTLSNLTLADDGKLFRVVFQNACGATTSSNALLTVFPLPSCLISGDNPVCANSSGNIFSAPAGMAAYAWSVSGNATLPGATNDAEVAVAVGAVGSFALTVTIINSNGCASTCSATFSNRTATATVSGSATNCPGGSSIIRANLTGVAPWTLVWSDGFVQSDVTTNVATRGVTPVSTTIYTVTSLSDSNCAGTATGSATITIGGSPVVTLHPTNRVVCPGVSVTFVSAASSVPAPAVQWQVSGDGGVNFSNISGATSTNYSFTTALADNGKFYRARFTNSCGSTTSIVAILSVGTSATPPASQSVCPGTTVNFSTTPSGLGPFTFQWRKGSTIISNATNSSLTLANVHTNDAGTYNVRVIGACNTVTNSATLSLYTPVNATPLVSIVRSIGTIASFTTTASGSGPFNYAWYHDGVLIPDQTNSTFVISNLVGWDNGTYSVTVNGVCGAVTQSGTLMVANCFTLLDVMIVIDRSGSMVGQPYDDARTACTNFFRNLRLLPGGDRAGLDTFNRTSMLDHVLTSDGTALQQAIASLPPASGGTCISCGLETAQNELGSIRHRPEALPVIVLMSDGVPKEQDNDSSTNALSWAAQARMAGIRLFTVGLNDGSGTNVDLALMIGMASSTNDSYYAESSSRLTSVFDAIATVLCRAPANSIITPLVDQVACPGATAMFNVTNISDCAPYSYAWRKDGALLTGQTNQSLTVANISAADRGTYTIEVNSLCRSVTNSATLTVNQVPQIIVPAASRTNCPGTSTSFSVTASGTGLAYQWYHDATLLAGETGNTILLDSVSAGDGGVYSVAVTGSCGTPVTNSATLFVAEELAITPLQDAIACPDSAVAFQITPSGTGPFRFLWRRNGVELSNQTNQTLVLAGLSATDAGTYSVEVSGLCGVETTAAMLSINTPTTVSGLADQTRCPGETVSFTALPAGTAGPAGFTFVWRKNEIQISGEHGASLTLSSVSSSDAGVYSVEVSGACNSATNSARLLVNESVTATPLNDAIRCVDASVSFNTVVAGTGPFNFVWRKDGVLLPGETGPSLNIAAVSSNSAGTYSVEVSGVCNYVTNSAALTVQLPTVATPLADLTKCVGETAVFATTPSGAGPFAFVWRKDGALLENQAADTLSVPVTLASAGVYSVEVSGACNSITSSASLTVNELTTTGAMANESRCPGDSVTFTALPGGTGPFTYAWRKDGALLPSARGASLELTNLTLGDNGGYAVEIVGGCNSATNFATLAVSPAPVVTLTNQTGCLGETVVLSVAPTGNGPFSFAWRKGDTLLANQSSNQLVLTNVTANDTGTYTVETTGPCGTATNSASLTLFSKVTATPLANQNRCVGANATFTTLASGSGPFTYVWRKDGVLLPGRTSFTTTFSGLAVADAGVYSVEISGACSTLTNSAALSVTTVPDVSGLADVAACPGSTVVLDANVAGTGNYSYTWRRNGFLLSDSTSKTLSIPKMSASKAGTYSLEINSICRNVTNSLLLTLKTNTSITPIADMTTCEGRAVTLSTVASGTGPFTYQWIKGGLNIAGATNSSFSIPSAALPDAGIYSVHVTGDCGTTNASATLIVNSGMTATPISDVTVCEGESVQLRTTVTGGSAPYTFVWRKYGTLIPGQTNSALNLAGTTPTDSGIYSVEISGCNSVTNSAVLTVRQLLSANMPTNIVACSCSDLVLGPVVSGTGPFHYVWNRKGVILPGETNIALNLGKGQTVRGGPYTVEITGPCNSVTNTTLLEVISLTTDKFSNTNSVVIPEFGAAAPYPSSVTVRCAPHLISQIKVTLNGLSHTFPDDLDIMLVGPAGQSIMLMSDAGGGSGNFLSNVDLIFSDAVTNELPDSDAIVTGVYKPTNLPGGDLDVFPAPAPASPTLNELSGFHGTDPNGVWSLYIVDDHGRDGGSLAGWSIEFGGEWFANSEASLSDVRMLPGGAFQMQLNGAPNKTYFIEASPDLQRWDLIQTNQLGGASAIITDTTAAQFHYRFYRASGCLY